MKTASVLCGALVPIVLVLALGTGSSAAAPHGCRDVIFIGARGSGEPLQVKKGRQLVTVFHGVGKPVDYMARLLEKDVSTYGETMGILPVNYNADSVDELKPSKKELAAMVAAGPTGAPAIFEAKNLRPYEASIAQGVTSTIGAIHGALDGCPETELVLAGYSQGAMAIHQAELRLEREGDEEALDAIGGTLLLGDGDRAPNTRAKIFGGAPAPAARGPGLLRALQAHRRPRTRNDRRDLRHRGHRLRLQVPPRQGLLHGGNPRPQQLRRRASAGVPAPSRRLARRRNGPHRMRTIGGASAVTLPP